MRLIASAVFLAVTAVAQKPDQPANVELTFEEVATQQHYRQQLRPQLHYTPVQGHIGDATGLVYHYGEFHLFNMYDAWSQKRTLHKQWGHAVSNDLIHWTQMPAILDKVLDNSPGSGSAVVDWNNSSGLRKGAEKTLVVFYTDYKRGTCMIYSTDRGRTWTRHELNPILPGVEEIRDPTVFWYAPAKEWRMLRYEKNGFAFYKSSDLFKWTYLSRIEGFHECPDLIHLPVENLPGQSRWVLVNGGGQYVVGDFDGTKFVPQTEHLKTEYAKPLYAGQTWKPNMDGLGPYYYIAWMRYPFEPRLSWNSQMSFPVELTLRSFPEGIRLCRKPVDQIGTLRTAQQSWTNTAVLPEIKGELLDIEAELEIPASGDVGLMVHGQEIRYSKADGKLLSGTATAPLKLSGNRLKLRIIVDRPSLEVYADEGQVSLSTVSLVEKTDTTVRLLEGTKSRVTALTVNHLESIWPEINAEKFVAKTSR
ncbi:MAG: glycoside hydrolase family 32 protein [Bryobacteraceae bacterium]|nr:glycoside hydrolase family 32 protein [Bryobacteraceae bacterium]